MSTVITGTRMKTINTFVRILFFLITGSAMIKAEKETPGCKLIVYPDSGKYKISKHIYGHFSEHLGRCIYDGIWVGENSRIPNTNGIRKDVIAAFKKINIPNMRWPGGCFADEYHWMDGIGPRSGRKKIINAVWGGTVEDNSFGTHEFLSFCELIRTEPYLSANVGSGSVEEMSKWVEYVNSDSKSSMAELRRKNGRDKPWNVKFWGIGNESWGCGGEMTAGYYSNLYRHYSTFCHDYSGTKVVKIACGASGDDYDWTRTLMKEAGTKMHGLSLHYYTVRDWTDKGSALKFTEKEYLETMHQALRIDTLISKHIKIMDEYDPEKKVGLMVDEWGTWYDADQGENKGILYQQNTLRDAFVAASTLNIFNKYADRIRMANLAQSVNVLQALILTSGEKMIVTPTYHVFDLFKVHQEAALIPSEFSSDPPVLGDTGFPALNVSCSSTEDGVVHISIVNLDPVRNIPFECELKGKQQPGTVTGEILTAPSLQAHNTFEEPELVKITGFSAMSLNGNTINMNIPSKSIIVLEIK